MKITILISALILTILSGAARAGRESGGGDDVALDFTSAFYEAYAKLSLAYPAAFAEIEPRNLPELVGKLHILVVERELFDSIFGQRVHVLTSYDTRRRVLLISRDYWRKTFSHEQEAWALHQILTIAALETRESFPYSSLLLNGSPRETILSGIKTKVRKMEFFRRPFCEGKPLFTGTVKEVSYYEEDWVNGHCSGTKDRFAWSYRYVDTPGECLGATKIEEAVRCDSLAGNKLIQGLIKGESK